MSKHALHIGIAGPVDLLGLSPLLDGTTPATEGRRSPVIASLIRGLHDRGNNLEVFTLSNDPRDQGLYEGSRLRLHVGQSRTAGKGRDALRVERQILAEQMTANPVDVLHAHWTYEFALAAMAVSDRAIVTVRDWWPAILRHHPHPYRVVRAGMQHRVLRRAPFLIANSAYTAEKVRRLYRREATVIPNPMAFPAELPDRPRSDPGAPVIGSVNNDFGRLKNVQALIKAWPRVRDRFPRARLRLIGTGYDPGGEAHDYALHTVGDQGIEFLGPLTYQDVLAQMLEFDVLVHPSREESFGSTLIEAIAQGTAVIGGDSSGAVPWVLDHGRCGWLTDVSKPTALGETIMTALSVPAAERTRHAASAFQIARKRFALDPVLDAHESLYEEVRSRPT